MGARMDRNNKKKMSGKKKVGITLLVILVIIIVLAGSALGYVYSKYNKMNHVEIDTSEIEINEGVDTGLRNIVLLGTDTRADNLDEGRSDCIIIASINEKTKQVKLISVYRDSYLKIPGRSLDKVTHAYAYGGPALSISTLNTNLDLDIKEFVAINFYVVMDVVDAVGGVNINVDSEELKYINGYIDSINHDEGKNGSHITTAGTQNLNGVQALAYARIRYTSGGDYKRTERMREVLTAVLNKAKKMNIGQLNNLADQILPSINTNVSASEILSLIPQIASYDVVESIGWPYEVKGATINKVWYGVPVNLEENVKRLHQEVFGETDYTPSETVKNISNSIIEKTQYK